MVGILKLSLFISDNQSLKEKRKILKSIVTRVHNKFNVSIAEVGSNDKWQIAELGICAAGNDSRFIDSTINTVISYIDSLYLGEIIDSKVEIFNV